MRKLRLSYMHIYSLKRLTILFIILMLSTSTLFAKTNDELTLTNTQQAWLKNHKVVRLASDKAWPPFEWINSEMQYRGIAADYMRLIETKLGIRFEVDKTKSWTEVVAAVKEHKLDVFSCVVKNPQRQKYVNFTRPYLSFPMVFITLDDVSYIDGIKDLKNMYVSVVKGYATHDYFKANYPDIKLYIVNTSEEGLEAVSQGKVNAFVDNIASATNIIQKRGLTNLKISGEMPVRYELSMAVRKDWPEFTDILQRALDSITDEQRKQIYNKWIGVRYEHSVDYSLFWKSFIVFVLIVFALYFYNRKLSQEIKQRKIAEKLAKKARDEANKANQAKSQFLSVMSHELRTPLTSIKGAIGILSGGVIAGIPEKALDMLKIANENSDRLAILINDILDIEKLLAGKMTFHKDELMTGDLIIKATTANQGYAEQYDVSFKLEINECSDVIITGDENRLIQVLSNFLSNAVKYSPKGGTVRISAECKGHRVRISVIDQGKGFPIEFKKNIFTYFSQADSSDAREKGGTGLGLAISREIIEHHGGIIGFNCEPGEDTTFYFELDINKN